MAPCRRLGVLDEQFPGVMRAMRAIKRGDHRRLAHFAQRIESRFMYGRVVPRIMAERPGLFVGTIHDSVFTTVGEEQYVRRVMLEEFGRLGVSAEGEGGGDADRESGRRPLDGIADTCNNAAMSKSKPQPTLTDVLRAAIERSGLTVYRIGKATGIDATNLGRFVRGEMSDSARQGRPARRLPGASAGAGPRRRAAGTDAGEPGTADAGEAKGEAKRKAK